MHEPVPHPSYVEITPDGPYVRHILVPLVQKGDELAIDFCCERMVIPLSASQTDCHFNIFRLSSRLPPLMLRTKRAWVYSPGVPSLSAEARTVVRPKGLFSSLSSILKVPDSFKGGRKGGPVRGGALRAGGDSDAEVAAAITARNAALADSYPDVLPIVLESQVMATVSVNIGKAGPDSGMRQAMLKMFFGRSEITAIAEGVHSGDRREVTMQFAS